MKKAFFAILITAFVINAFAQQSAKLSVNGQGLNLVTNTDQMFVFSNFISTIEFKEAKTTNGSYTRMVIDGYTPTADIGKPELPSINRLIEIPTGARIRTQVVSYEEQVIHLDELGLIMPLIPTQPSLFKNENPADVEFVKDNDFYNGSSSYEPELIQIEMQSKMRGMNVAKLMIQPFSYDAASNTLTVKNNLVVEIHFDDAEFNEYSNTKEKYYSPAFETAYNRVWNYRAPATKDALSQYPITYVIVSDPMFQDALQEFIEWKTKKGFYVIEAYTNNPEVGNTVAGIKAFLKNLYDNGTPNNPAPTYVLFVGDVAQIPVTTVSQHVTDMYTVEFDGGGDYIPEMYFGRFSATSVAQLLPQIEKTLMYEQYSFPNPAFLSEVVLVAGEDSNYGPTHANGQINYAHQYYFNEDHGASTPYVYLYPASGSSASAIIANLSNGVGFVNYTAHCGSNGWGGPSFTTTNIPGLQNQDEYFFSIGNCCLSNKFNEAECFGEALLRADKKGAVVHIGGSNNTLWNEDFYWSVGVTSTVTANPTYANTSTAAYDHLFHENMEDPYVTAYQMCYIGNMAVMQGSANQAKYYWEIYHVMGDPSLMPYVGVPPAMNVEYTPSLPIGVDQLMVTTEPGAYVAISNEGVLLDAQLADSNGEALLQFESFATVANADIVVTKQFRQPYFGTLQVIPNDNDYDVMLKTIVLPESILNVADATFQPEVQIMNLGQLPLTSASVSYQIDENTPVSITWEGNIGFLETATVVFPEISLNVGQYVFTATTDNPNGEEDQFPSNNQASRNVLVYSGNVSLVEVLAPIDLYCNQVMFEPVIRIRNLDATPLTSLVCGFTVNSTTYEFTWEGNVVQNEYAEITFPNWWFIPGTYTMNFYIHSPNGGSDMNESDNTASKSFRINSPGQLVRFTLLTDNYGSEVTWELTEDASSDVVYSGGPYSDAVETYEFDWCLANGCYTFTIYDSYGDGMSGTWWWGIPPGNINITNLETEDVYIDALGDTYQQSKSVSFCIDINVGMEASDNQNLRIYPNPAREILNIAGTESINSITVYNSLGQVVNTHYPQTSSCAISTENMPSGVYIISVETKFSHSKHRVVVTK